MSRSSEGLSDVSRSFSDPVQTPEMPGLGTLPKVKGENEIWKVQKLSKALCESLVWIRAKRADLCELPSTSEKDDAMREQNRVTGENFSHVRFTHLLTRRSGCIRRSTTQNTLLTVRSINQ